MRRLSSLAYGLVPPIVAFVFALLATALVIMAAGGSVPAFIDQMISMPQDRVQVNILNHAAVLAIAGFAAAIGFRMGLFNIGIEGQYTIGACAGAFFAGSGIITGPLVIPATLIVAAAVGALWAGIAAVLKVGRGVSEVVTSIMLNYIALSLAGYLVARFGQRAGMADITPPLDEGSRPGGFGILSPTHDIWALSVLAIVIAVGYWFLIANTRFGFDLRASGASASAAAASGVRSGRMIITAMCLSGAVAGIIWLPAYFGSVHRFGLPENFQAGLGFMGLAVALLGRNRSAGILLAALLFAYLSAQSNRLQSVGIAQEIVEITQGIVVLAVVVAYEVAGRIRSKREQEKVAADLEAERSELEGVSR